MPYKDKNKEKLKSKQYYYDNKEEMLATSKEYYKNNRERIIARQKTYYEANKDKVLKYRREHDICRYFKNLGKDEALEYYNNLIKIQDNKCAMCGKPEKAKNVMNGQIQALSIDHCHKSGKVRGLLCKGCNTVLGQFENNSEQIFKYLDRFEDDNENN